MSCFQLCLVIVCCLQTYSSCASCSSDVIQVLIVERTASRFIQEAAGLAITLQLHNNDNANLLLTSRYNKPAAFAMCV